MPYILNEKLVSLVPYEPLSGNYPVRLDANESYRKLPISIMREIDEAVLCVDYNRYPDPTAHELCEAFANYYEISPNLVTAGNGSDELIFVILSAFLMKGDKVFILSPDFSMYNFYSSLVESPSLILNKGDSLEINIDDVIQRANEENVRMIIFSNPCNPTSLGWTREEMDKLIRSVDALVVLDEAYMDFWDQSMLANVEDYDNLIILRTMSKAIGMAAIRLGFAVSNPTITNSIRAVKSPYNVNSITQVMGKIVLSHGNELIRAKNELIASRDYLYESCKALALSYPEIIYCVYETRTNFVTIRTPFANEIFNILKENGVLVRCFTGLLRVTCGTNKENSAFLNAMGKALESLKA